MSPFAERIRHEPGAALAADGSIRFDGAAATGAVDTGCRVPLLDWGVVAVAGADARAFLHAQLISDLQQPRPTVAPLSAWCTPQGRVQFLLRVVEHDERFLLLLPRADVPRLVQRLRMFVLRARVLVEDASEDFALLGIVPDSAEAAASAPSVSGAPATVAAVDGCRSIALESTPLRRLLLGAPDDVAAVWDRSALPPAGTAIWRWLDARSGLPWLPPALAGRFLPQQLNLDWLGAMSYGKGCYPGQEVIARIRYRGTVKSRLLAGRTRAAAIASGAHLRRAGAVPGQSSGEVLFATAGADGFTAVQAVAALDALDTGLETEDGTAVEFARPPYWPQGD